MGLSRTVSEIDGDFHRKSQNFPTTLYFALLLKGFNLELGTGAGGQKTRMMELLGRQRSLTISSAFWIQCTNVTDGHRATAKTALKHSVAVIIIIIIIITTVLRCASDNNASVRVTEAEP